MQKIQNKKLFVLELTKTPTLWLAYKSIIKLVLFRVLNNIFDSENKEEGIIPHMMNHKLGYLLLASFIGTCVYIYQSRKAMDKSVDDIKKEIYAMSANLERFLKDK